MPRGWTPRSFGDLEKSLTRPSPRRPCSSAGSQCPSGPGPALAEPARTYCRRAQPAAQQPGDGTAHRRHTRPLPLVALRRLAHARTPGTRRRKHSIASRSVRSVRALSPRPAMSARKRFGSTRAGRAEFAADRGAGSESTEAGDAGSDAENALGMAEHFRHPDYEFARRLPVPLRLSDERHSLPGDRPRPRSRKALLREGGRTRRAPRGNDARPMGEGGLD